MSLTTADKQDIRTIVDEVVTVRIKSGTAHLPTIEIVREIVRKEIDTSIKPLDERVGRLEISYNNLGKKVNRLEEFAEDAKIEIYKLGVLLEDGNSRLQAVAEAVVKYIKINTKVDNHEFRLEEIESKQPLIIKTLAFHSKQLGAKS